MSNSFTSVFGPAGGGADATKLPLAGGTLTGALTLPNSIFSGLSLTGSQATNTIDVSTTWNTTGNPALFYGRATNTASGTTAKLMSLGTAAGGELFAISKLGSVEVKSNGTDAAPSFSLTGVSAEGSAGIRYGSAGLNVVVVAQGTPVCAIGYQLFRVGSTGVIGWSSSQFNPDTSAADLSLVRTAAASLQIGASLVSGWVSQTIAAGGGRIGTDTNNSPTNTLTIAGSISTGTGTGGNLRLGVYGTNGTSGTAIGTLNTVLTVVAARKVINIAGIPTSSAGLSSGDVYSNAGILTIVA